MKAYKYDKNGLFIGVTILQRDPLTSKKEKKDVYFSKPNTTFKKPIISENKIAYFENDEWVYYDGLFEAYDKETKKKIITDEKIFNSKIMTKKIPPEHNEDSYSLWNEKINDWEIREYPPSPDTVDINTEIPNLKNEIELLKNRISELESLIKSSNIKFK